MKVSAAISNDAAKQDHRTANLSSKTGCTTRKWMGIADQLRQQKRLAPYIDKCAKEKVARMREYHDTANCTFLDKVDDHLKYLN